MELSCAFVPLGAARVGVTSSLARGPAVCAFTGAVRQGLHVRGVRLYAPVKRNTANGRSTTTTMGLLPLIPNWLVLGYWAFMGSRFYRGFENTTYTNDYKLLLAAAWPFLFAFNSRYRKNFRKALESGKDSRQ